MLTRDERIGVSRAGVAAPFELDPTLCLYSPQDNVDALAHPRVVAWHRFVTTDWMPGPRDDARRRILLLLPCTKPKPYATSREHRAINGALLRAGWRPSGDGAPPAGLAAVLDPDEDPAVLHVGALVRDGVRLDRMVLSEPLAAVPYEHLYSWPGGVSPATAYDDPGLFESRGSSVSPERADCTAVEGPDGRWVWGPAEHDAYVTAHAAMVDVQTAVLRRVAGTYDHVLAWVSPYLTHRSFLLDAAQRAAEGAAAAHVGVDGPRTVSGVNDALPGAVEILPMHASFGRARFALGERLRAEGRASGPDELSRAWDTGDGNDTPLGLPDLLPELLARLDAISGRSAA